jgi:NTP pyrophosphatase (non-canonical NTP hydrolase)
MYYVYYIKGIKIGCTKNLKKRVEQEQGYKDYTILFKSKDIKKASNAERYFQEQLGYKVDLNTYENLTNNKTKTKKMIKKTNHTVTFKVEKNNIDKEFLLNLGVINDLNGRDIIICEELSDWILKNLKKSQFNNEMFIYNQSLINAYDFLIENKELENLNIFDLIRQWAEDKGIYKSGDARTQYVKLMEEAGELAQAILKNDEPEVIDAIGDMVVVLTNLAKLRGHNIENCIKSAYDIIKSRQGKMINGTFVKNN